MGGELCRIWFDRGRDSEGRLMDNHDHIAEVCEHLNGWLARANSACYVVGLSTGGAMALHAAAHMNGLAGVACLSGYLPCGDDTYAKLRTKHCVPRILCMYGDA